LVLVDRAGSIRFREEIIASADVDTELARQIDEVIK
jgi:hypothetical protein